jgi:hypothetical protein
MHLSRPCGLAAATLGLKVVVVFEIADMLTLGFNRVSTRAT